MANNTLQNVFDAARGYLHDTAIAGGEVWTNTALQVHFNEPYRRMFNCLMGTSKRVQRVVYVNFPANTTILIPAFYNITDFDEPELIEERQGQNAITITSTDTSTPIRATATAHGLGTAGQQVEGVVSGVANTSAPWGHWFVTIIDANTFSLNGSVTDAVAGAGGVFVSDSQAPFTEVLPIDMDFQGTDGVPQQSLGCYLWREERLIFRGSTDTQQLRITYWASGTPPTNANTVINIDNCIDFLACATAANAARANGWYELAGQLEARSFGQGGDTYVGGLLGDFTKIQILTLQRGPQRRRLPFRDRRSRFGNYILG